MSSAQPVIQILTARNLVRSLLNASTTYGTNDDPLRHPDAELDDAIIGADQQVIGFILSIPGHPRRQLYTVSTAVAHDGVIPQHIGEVGRVLVSSKLATWCPAEYIEKLRAGTETIGPGGAAIATVAGLDGPYYDIIGDRLYYYPDVPSAQVSIARYIPAVGALLSPPEYFNTVVAQALAYLCAKEGELMGPAQHYKSLADEGFEQIKIGAQKLPPIIPYQRGQQ